MFTFLPRGYREDTIREYRKRVLAVFLLLCIVLAALSIALAMPTFMSLYFQRNQALFEKDRAERIQAESADASAGAETTKLKERLSVVEAMAGEWTMLSILEKVLVHKTPGISIVSFGVARDGGKASVEGIALTRDALVAFSRSLQGEPSFSKVDLPVSSLAKNRDIAFRIAIELAK